MAVAAGRLAGRRVLVIGAGQETYGLAPEEVSLGNGRACCLRLAAEGSAVACADLHRERVNVIVPGLIDTPMGRIATRDRPSRTTGQLPLGAPGHSLGHCQRRSVPAESRGQLRQRATAGH